MAWYARVIMLTLLTPASALAFDFTPIDVPGASFTLARGINPRGDIVGFYVAGVTSHGFLLHESTFTDIDVVMSRNSTDVSARPYLDAS
jgi:hypothetical protein